MIKQRLVLTFILLIAFIYLFYFQLKAIFPFTIDDMYISLRYANHLAMGKGLLWNLNEPPVEGYTNFSFVILAYWSIILKLNPVLVLKIAGIIGLLFSSLALYFLSRFWFSKLVSLIPLFWLLSYYGQIIWTASGLETTIYQALISFALFFLFKGMGYHFSLKKRSEAKIIFLVLSAILLVLAALTRPEAPFLALLFFSLALLDRPSINRKSYYKKIITAILIFGLSYLPYFVWRLIYFDSLFPNSVACKGFSDYSLAVDNDYLKLAWPFLLLSLFALLKTKDKRIYFVLLPSLLYLLLLIGADTVAVFDNRLFLPAFLLLLPPSLLGLKLLLGLYFKTEGNIFFYGLAILSFLFAFFFIPMASLENYRQFTKNPIAGEQLRTQVLNWLQLNAKDNSRVVLGDSGMIPYFSKLNFIDSYCLNNKEMTRKPKRDIYNRLCKDVFVIKPEILILTSLIEKGHTLYAPTDLCLKKVLSEPSIYQLKQRFETKDKDYQYRYEIYKIQS